MEIQPPVKLLLIYIDDTDTWRESRVPVPLYEAIVRMLFENGISGATVHNGVMGFGVNRRLHRKHLFGVTDEKPVTISVVENEEKLRAIAPKIAGMVREGLIVLVDAEVIHHGFRHSASVGPQPA